MTKSEYDVFGDGTVVIMAAPGHSPGHQVLFLKLKKTGPVVLSGDLYHYPGRAQVASDSDHGVQCGPDRRVSRAQWKRS